MPDISTIKTNARTIEILHPGDGSPLGVRVNLVSIDDEALTKIKRKITDDRLHMEARGKSFKAEQVEDNKHNILFAAINNWEWYDGTTFHGDVPEFNRKNVLAVFIELPWFADQINEAVGDTKAFFDNSKAS